MKKQFFRFFILSFTLFNLTYAFSQTENNFPKDMLILQSDIIVEAKNAPGTTEANDEASGKNTIKTKGVNIYIRKKSGIESVMLVETTKDPNGKQDNYAYRALEYNTINGDEIRYLDGKVLDSKYGKYSLISSTVVNHPALGKCFHIYIPPVVEYGYSWARHGTVEIGKGMFINIRTFSRKYGDYTGKFADNPFMFDFAEIQKKAPPPVVEKKVEEPQPKVEPEPKPIKEPIVLTLTDDYNPEAADKFNEIAKKGQGLLRYSKGPETLPEDLIETLDAINPKDKVDVVFAIDTTGSMKDDIETLRKEWVPKLIEQLKDFGDLRLGLLIYRDYGDNYSCRGLPVKFFAFTNDISIFKRNLNSVVIHGNEGGDVPEAVYEALYGSINFFKWREDAQKKVILIGDAEPHPTPRGSKKITQDEVLSLAKENKITLDCIIVPDDKSSSRGR